ncbi:MAG: ATP-binding cassette domain-containing protein [Pseudomonadota bacterium]
MNMLDKNLSSDSLGRTMHSEMQRLAISLLDSACAGDLQQSLASFTHIRGYIKRSSLEKILYDVASGNTPINRSGALYLLGKYEGDSYPIIKEIEKNIDFLEEKLAEAAPVFLIELSSAGVNASFSIAVVDGLGFVHLDIDNLYKGEGYSGVSQRATISHEIAHCFLYSGNRFLDEGFATYIECLRQTRPLEEVVAGLKEDPNLPDIRTVLSLVGGDDHFFKNAYPQNPHLIYIKGIAFIDYIIEAFGVETLKKIFRHPLINQPNAIGCTVIEKITACSLDGFEEKIRGNSIKNADHHGAIAISPEEKTQLHLIAACFLRSEYALGIAQLSQIEHLYQRCPEDLNVLESMIQIKLMQFFSKVELETPDTEISSYHIADIEGLIQKFTSLSPDSAESAHYKISLNIIKLKMASYRGQEMKIKLLSLRISSDYTVLQERFPTFVPLIISEAKFIAKKPAKFGGGRAEARKFLIRRSVGIAQLEQAHLKFWIDCYGNENEFKKETTLTPVLAKRDEILPNLPSNSIEAGTGDQILSAAKVVVVNVDHVEIQFENNFSLLVKGLSIYQGEFVVLVGGNGAGKSTLLDAVLGLVECKRSDISLFGLSALAALKDNHICSKIGAQLQKSTYSRNIKVKELVRLHEKLYGKVDKNYVFELGIDKLLDKFYEDLSRGEKQRLDLFIAISHEPELILLDEPGTGLDARYADNFYSLLANLRNKKPKTAILCASHSSRDIDISTTITWLKAGRVQANDDAKTLLKKLVGEIKGSLKCSDPAQMARVKEELTADQRVAYSHILKDGTMVIYAQSNFKDALVEIAKNTGLSAFSYSASNSDDFLDYINNH